MSPGRDRRVRAVTGLVCVDDFLCADTAEGPLPLYRFVPLQLAVICGQSVPFAATWAEYLKPLLYTYSPVPRLPTPTPDPALAADLGWQTRDASGLRPWEQATYRGWPLYLCTRDQPSDAARCELHDLFERVHIALRPLPPRPDHHRGDGP